MYYSQMTLRQRQELFEDPRHYPLRVTFLGKTGLLSFEAVSLMVSHEVDFAVDDGQFEETMATMATMAKETTMDDYPAGSIQSPPEDSRRRLLGLEAIPPASPHRSADLWTGAIALLAVLAAVVYASRRVMARFSAGQPKTKPRPDEHRRQQGLPERARQRLSEARVLLAIVQEVGRQVRARR